MSNVTLHHESVNFLVDMRDEWESPDTICDSVTVFIIHRMSKLHVCVDCIIFPLGSVILNGDDVIFLLTTGAPCNRKCPVALESEIEYWTSSFLFVERKLWLVLRMLSIWFVCTILGCLGVILLLYVLTVEHLLLVHTVSSLSSSSCGMGKMFVRSSYLWVGYRLLDTLTVVLILQASSNDAAAPPCQAWWMPGFTGKFTLWIALLLT